TPMRPRIANGFIPRSKSKISPKKSALNASTLGANAHTVLPVCTTGSLDAANCAKSTMTVWIGLKTISRQSPAKHHCYPR
ncbi:hypothetical protein GGI08_009900, partial [Coemansia sp. S2]